MNVTNQMYSLFRTMKEGYANDRYDVVESAARCWLMFDPENPFNPDSPEHEAFFQMQRCFTIWRNGDINARINKKKMVEFAKQLCALNPKQPYKYDKKADEEEALQKEAQKVKTEEQPEEVQEEKKVKHLNPKQVVLGVPQEEEKKSWLRFLHPWRKDDKNDSP